MLDLSVLGILNTFYLSFWAAIQELNEQSMQGDFIHDMKNTWVKPVAAVKELDVCSSSQNLLWSFPGRGFFYSLQISPL